MDAGIIPALAFMTIGAVAAFAIVYGFGFMSKSSNKEDVKRAFSDDTAGIRRRD
ncbi:hypothetical protein A33M_1609 [Rhodovulum sp. PH10]|uniref:hypothetical protein n=1 Tax=Rhodovulum sp. PH10 TaxID=1187851 RepID=UPI00027C21A5|nr:hypothetical protein [Rhodovulum sp. PH10]EJW12820.1 hypothetical protein A33M_1609 [Rhodovulum sp. PH10]